MTEHGCTFCVDAGPDFDECHVCGRGASQPATRTSFGPLFAGQRPVDPVATRTPEGLWACHCGWLLDAEHGVEVEEAPGPVVSCQNCGCAVAIPRKAEA